MSVKQSELRLKVCYLGYRKVSMSILTGVCVKWAVERKIESVCNKRVSEEQISNLFIHFFSFHHTRKVKAIWAGSV